MLVIVSPLHFAWFVSGSRSFICCYLIADVIHCTVLLPGSFAISISLRFCRYLVYHFVLFLVPGVLSHCYTFSLKLLLCFSFPGMRSSLVCLFVSSWPMLFIACFVSGSRIFLCCCLIADVMHLSMVCPRMGGPGNPREIWHFQVFKCQFPHPWVSIVSQIPTPGDHRPSLNEMIGTNNKFIAALLQTVTVLVGLTRISFNLTFGDTSKSINTDSIENLTQGGILWRQVSRK